MCREIEPISSFESDPTPPRVVVILGDESNIDPDNPDLLALEQQLDTLLPNVIVPGLDDQEIEELLDASDW